MTVLEQKLAKIFKLAVDDENRPIPVYITLPRRKLSNLVHKNSTVIAVLSVEGANEFATKLEALGTNVNLPLPDDSTSKICKSMIVSLYLCL